MMAQNQDKENMEYKIQERNEWRYSRMKTVLGIQDSWFIKEQQRDFNRIFFLRTKQIGINILIDVDKRQ